MAYATSNPPQLLVPSLGSKPALWAYASTDTTATVAGAGYFTNGSGLGMKVTDFMLISQSTGEFALGKVTSVTASSAATVTVGAMTST